MTPSRCAIPRCRSDSALIYLGRGICRDHWIALGTADVTDEPAFLADLGLRRTEDGYVVENEDSVQ